MRYEVIFAFYAEEVQYQRSGALGWGAAVGADLGPFVRCRAPFDDLAQSPLGLGLPHGP